MLWRVPLPGTGHGSPVVAGNRIFLLSGDPKTSERMALCVDTRDGSLVWSKTYPSARFKGHRHNSPASNTPALDETHVYYVWGSKQELIVTALTHDGEEVWQTDLGPVQGGHGFGASPIVDGGLVVLNNDQDQQKGFLVALHQDTGDVAWKIPRRSTRLSYSVPVVKPTPQGDVLVFTNWRHGFTAVDPATGRVLSDVSVFDQDHNERAISSPVLAGDLVIGTCGFTNEPKHAVAMRWTGSELEEVWRIERNVPHIPSVLVVNQRAYLWEDSGIGTCVDTETGEVIWRERIGGATYFSSPVSDGKHIFNIDSEGTVVVLETGDEFREVARFSLGTGVRSQSTPALAHGNLYLRTATELMAIGPGTRS